MWRDCSQTGDVITAWQDNKPRQYDMIMRNGVVDTEGNHTKLDMSYKPFLESRDRKPVKISEPVWFVPTRGAVVSPGTAKRT